jgi:hypothetical protein
MVCQYGLSLNLAEYWVRKQDPLDDILTTLLITYKLEIDLN